MSEIPIEDVIRENIKALRKRLVWSQDLLAEKTGVSGPYITQIEVGKRTPSLDIKASSSMRRLTSPMPSSRERIFVFMLNPWCVPRALLHKA